MSLIDRFRSSLLSSFLSRWLNELSMCAPSADRARPTLSELPEASNRAAPSKLGDAVSEADPTVAVAAVSGAPSLWREMLMLAGIGTGADKRGPRASCGDLLVGRSVGVGCVAVVCVAVGCVGCVIDEMGTNMSLCVVVVTGGGVEPAVTGGVLAETERVSGRIGANKSVLGVGAAVAALAVAVASALVLVVTLVEACGSGAMGEIGANNSACAVAWTAGTVSCAAGKMGANKPVSRGVFASNKPVLRGVFASNNADVDAGIPVPGRTVPGRIASGKTGANMSLSACLLAGVASVLLGATGANRPAAPLLLVLLSCPSCSPCF